MLTVRHLAQLAQWFEAGPRLSNLPRVVCCLAVREGCNVSLMLWRMSAAGTNVDATSCRKDFDTEERKVSDRAIDHVAERALAEYDAGKIRDLLRILTARNIPCTKIRDCGFRNTPGTNSKLSEPAPTPLASVFLRAALPRSSLESCKF